MTLHAKLLEVQRLLIEAHEKHEGELYDITGHVAGRAAIYQFESAMERVDNTIKLYQDYKGLFINNSAIEEYDIRREEAAEQEAGL